MQTIKIKYKYIISGFPSINGDYKIHNFKYIKRPIDLSKFDLTDIENTIYVGHFLNEYSYTTKDDDKKYYNCLECDDYFNYNISSKCIFNKEKLNLLFSKYPDILLKADKLVKELRLVLNIPISIYIQILEVYSSDEMLIGKCVYFVGGTFWNKLSYIDAEELSKNARFHINYDLFTDVKLERYHRALSFFYDSFDSEKKEIRFIMLMSSLECLFNYKLRNSESITHKVSTIFANIFSTFDGRYDYYYQIAKVFYDKRSKYLHGNNNTISEADEKELRKYSRIILLFVSLVIINNSFSLKEMLKYLENNKQYNLQDKLFLTALFAKDFKEQQLGLLDVIKKSGFKIPKETENFILSKTF